MRYCAERLNDHPHRCGPPSPALQRARFPRAARLELLERRALLSAATVTFGDDGTVFVTGTDAVEIFQVATRVNASGQRQVNVLVNDEPFEFNVTDLHVVRVSLVGGAGDDSFTTDTPASVMPVPVVLDGGDGRDTFYVGAGDVETILGGEGDDAIVLTDVASEVTAADGGAGTDWVIQEQQEFGPLDLSVYANVENAHVQFGPVGIDAVATIIGNGLDNLLIVDYGNAVLRGEGGDDRLVGAADFTSLLDGGDGNDLFYGGRLGDTMIGGAGTDTADYSARAGNLVITADGVADDGEFGEFDNVGSDVERIIGGSGNDLIVGSGKNNVLRGGAGDDTLNGNGGEDAVFGQDGNDLLYGSSGDDHLEGGAGSDTLVAGAGIDSLYGKEGDDTLVIPTDASDAATLSGGDGIDLVDFSAWTDNLTVSLDDVEGDGARGTGRMNVLSDVENVIAGSGDDAITGSDHDNIIWGGPGRDRVWAGYGHDTLFGDDGDDLLSGNAGKDRIFGGLGRDRLNGHGGHDRLYGEAGVDRLYGYAGNDWLDGGSSTDRLYSAGGQDTLLGQGGNDYLYARDGGFTLVYGGGGTDRALIDDTDELGSIEDLLA